MSEEKSRVGDPLPAAVLVGVPVDERRPSHMSREEYLKKHPGRNTHQFLVDAGLKKETRSNRGWLIATGAAFLVGLVALLLRR